MFPNDANGAALRTRTNAASPHEGLGNVVHKTKNLLKCVYDFSVSGGAVSTINLLDDYGSAALLPYGAIVTNVVVSVNTAVTSAGSATVAVGSGIASATADLLAATAKASLASGFVAGTPVGTAATWAGPVTVATGSQVTATVGTAALTAGKLTIFIEYVIQG